MVKKQISVISASAIALLAVCVTCRNMNQEDVSNIPADPVYNIPVNPGSAYLKYRYRDKDLYFATKQSAEHFMESPESSEKPAMLCGWYSWRPYQYGRTSGKPDGLCVNMVREVLSSMDIPVVFEQNTFDCLLEKNKYGLNDLTSAAYHTKARSEYAWYSDPLIRCSEVLILGRGCAAEYPFDDADSMIRMFEQTGFRLGVVKGYSYADPAVNRYIRDNTGSGRILFARSETACFQQLFDGGIDGFLVDRIVGASIAWKRKWQNQIEEHPGLRMSKDLHILFSKISTSRAFVDNFNQHFQALKRSGRYSAIVREHAFPVLIAQTIEKGWFFNVDILGTIAFALSGLLLARRERYDIFGAFVLGALPALGGGILRDILVDRRPVAVLRTPYYIYTILITVIAGFLLIRLYSKVSDVLGIRDQALKEKLLQHFNLAIQVFDGLGLAAFTIIGVVIAVEARCEPLWIWGALLATVTSSGGKLLRDIVRGVSEIDIIKGSFYPIVSLIWGFLLSCFLIWQTSRINQDEIFYAVVIAIIGTFLTRMIAFRCNWKTPTF